MKFISTVLLIAIFSLPAISQEYTKAIEDNSFFIEEAYNQEDGVIQHIFTGFRLFRENTSEGSFTEEWPVFNQTHQASITIPFHHTTVAHPSSQGIGDIMLNYRFEAWRSTGLAVAPRISIILPTGEESNGFGNGRVGVQINLPMSKRISNDFVSHFNAGATVIPDVQFTTSKAALTEYFVGASGIYLVGNNFNILTEILYSSSGSPFGRTNELIVSPGVRWAIDINNLQIVPGLVFPALFTNGTTVHGIFIYLSFEHIY
ncbi:MAG: transporter [Bacteroidota bacterium]